MNVIVSNRQKEIIDNANIDAIKDLNGLFNVDDLINKFKNYFFSKMILDATSVVNFASREVWTTLVNEIGAEKLIILLPADPEPPLEFKKLLVELKIYNFTNKIEEVIKFIENPNTYEDVMRTIDANFDNNMYVDNSIKENDDPNQNNVVESPNENSNQEHRSLGDMLINFNLQNTTSDESNNFGTDIVYSNEESSEKSNDVEENNDEPKMETNNSDNVSLSNLVDLNMESQDNNSGKNMFLISDSIDDTYDEGSKDKIVIGVKNVTLHAGSTSLIYMMHKIASSVLKIKVLSVEVNKKDFKLYRDAKMICVESKDVKDIIDKSNEELILVDLNDCDDISICTEVIYLVEPSTIKLNRLMIENKEIFKDLKNKKVVLNKSLLSDNDVRTLSSEAGMEFFYSLEPLNDRIINDSIMKLLNLLSVK